MNKYVYLIAYETKEGKRLLHHSARELENDFKAIIDFLDVIESIDYVNICKDSYLLNLETGEIHTLEEIIIDNYII